MAASTYHIQVSEAFDSNPERFITELSKEDNETIIHHSFHLASEQYYKTLDYTSHEDYLTSLLSKAEPSSALADTITLLYYGNLMCESCDDSETFLQRNYTKIQNAYQSERKLLLLSLSEFINSYTIPHTFAEALVFCLDASELEALDDQLAADAAAQWATADIQNIIKVIREQVAAELNPPPPATDPTDPITEPTSLPSDPPNPTTPTPTQPTLTEPKQNEGKLWIIIATSTGLSLIGIAIVVFIMKKRNHK
jgi:hypothetical protein